MKKSNILALICLQFLLAVYSCGGIFSKFAAKSEFLSLRFLLFYSGIVFLLGIYAIVWQQIIKHLPLTTAYANKAVNIVWGILWGMIIFHEQIKWNMILGAIIVIFGVILVVKADE